MRTAALILFAAIVPVAGAAPVPKHLMKEAENPDLAALQGKWTITGIALDGTELPADLIAGLNLTFEFKGDTAVLTNPTQKETVTATVKLDLTAKPRRITFSNEKTTDLDGKPTKADAKSLGTLIYKIDGDTLVVAGRADSPDKKAVGAPDDFVGKPGSNTATLTFKRVTK